jgi:hypothetical protein
MKVRAGFVSNSSSSSFVVGFPYKPKTVEELRYRLFGDKELFPGYYDDVEFPTSQIAEVVFRDLNQQEPMNQQEVLEEIRSGYFDGHPEFSYHYDPKETDEQMRERWDEESRQTDAAAEALFQREIAPRWEKLEFYRFTYSDNDGPLQTTMEHGGIFDALTHLRISHH